jgi:hypothetical protein
MHLLIIIFLKKKIKDKSTVLDLLDCGHSFLMQQKCVFVYF